MLLVPAPAELLEPREPRGAGLVVGRRTPPGASTPCFRRRRARRRPPRSAVRASSSRSWETNSTVFGDSASRSSSHPCRARRGSCPARRAAAPRRGRAGVLPARAVSAPRRRGSRTSRHCALSYGRPSAARARCPTAPRCRSRPRRPSRQRVGVRQLRWLVVALHHGELGRLDRRRGGAYVAAAPPTAAGRARSCRRAAADELAHHPSPPLRVTAPVLSSRSPDDQPQQRRLARAVRADQGDVRPRRRGTTRRRAGPARRAARTTRARCRVSHGRRSCPTAGPRGEAVPVALPSAHPRTPAVGQWKVGGPAKSVLMRVPAVPARIAGAGPPARR